METKEAFVRSAVKGIESKQEEKKEGNNEQVNNDTSKFSEAEQRAYEKGWRPKEEWDESSGKPWISAEEFERRGELFSRIESQNKEIKELKKAFDMLVDHNRKLEEADKNAAIERLNAMRAEAISNNEGAKVVKIEEQIEEVKKIETKLPEPSKTTSAAFDKWVADNNWYLEDKELHSFADSLGVGYKIQNREKSDEEVYEYVTNNIKKLFPEKFGKPAKKEEAPVDSSPRNRSSSTTSSKSIKVSDLSDDEKKVMNVFVKQRKIMTQDQYLEQLAAAKGIK